MEFFDVLDSNGHFTGQRKARVEVHRDGDWHRSVHVWLCNEHGELLLQKRAPDKDSNPNLWDVSAAGHISAGDTSLRAALRETREELGIDVEETHLQFLFTVTQSAQYPDLSFLDNEFQDVYLVHTTLPLDQFSFQQEEVSELRYISLPALQQLVEQQDETLVTHPQEYPALFATLLGLNPSA